MHDTVFVDVNLATMTPGGEPYGAIRDGVLATTGDRISFVGSRRELSMPPDEAARRVIRCDGAWLTPGLIDCHTHLVFAGNRADEFEQRLQGVSYAEIARRGGGIVSTVHATREAAEEELVDQALVRLDALRNEGVTTVEIKSGYGLSTVAEVKMLRAARSLGTMRPVTVRTTFLGAHALPPEYRDRQDAYVDLVCDEMLPEVVRLGLADAVDAFCENIAFSPAETARIFEAARSLGLPVKLHAEQLSDQGGAALAARFGALSADHLEYVSEDGVRALAESGTVAVLLPGAFYMLGETTVPPVEMFRAYGVPMAVSTDCNPGSSPVTSLLLMLNMSCVLFGLTVEEALMGVTRHAARALGLEERCGTLEDGKQADLVLWDIEGPADLVASIGRNPRRLTFSGGIEV